MKGSGKAQATVRGVLRTCAPLGLIAIVAIVLAACGSSSSSSGGSGGGTSSGGSISASMLSQLRASINTAKQVPKFVAPGPPVDASVLKGKSLTVMPINSEIDACTQQAKDFAALGKSLGASVTLSSNAGQPSQWVSGIQDSISGHDAAMAMLCGIIPGAVGPQLAAAHKAGVKIVDGNYNEVSNYKGLDGETAVQVAEGMKNDVDAAILAQNGKPLHVLLVSSNSIVQGPASVAAVTGEVKRVCGSACSVQTVLVPIQNWATQIQSEVASTLLAHSDINAIVVAFDGMTTFAVPAIQHSRDRGLKIYTWGGSRSVEKLMLSPSSVVVADPGPDEQWDAYEAMDQVIRLVGGHPAASVDKEVDPNRFWDASNVKQFFGPGGTYGNEGYGGNAFITGFRKLWGLS